MANMSGYDASQGQTMDDRDILPAGEYVAVIVKSARTASKKDARNEYLALEFEVTEGQAAGRRFWANINLWNSNQQAAEIAQREMNTICHAVGRLRINDSEELHGIPMRVKLSVDEGSGQYGPQNRVKGYKPLNDTGARAGHTGQAQASQSGGAQAPWGRRSA